MGFPKLQIIFHKRATEYTSLLREMTYEDKWSYESSPPFKPRTEEIRLQTITTVKKIQQVSTGVPVHIKYVFSGVPEISNGGSRE